jgi:hypothetical protein
MTKRVLEEIYLLYVRNTYYMNFECVWVHWFSVTKEEKEEETYPNTP